MAKAKNEVISGNLAGAKISFYGNSIVLSTFTKEIKISKRNLVSLDLISSDKKKDTGSSIARGIVGGVLLGPIGLVGGAVLGKTNGIHLVSLVYNNDKRSLLEVDDKFYKQIITTLY